METQPWLQPQETWWQVDLVIIGLAVLLLWLAITFLRNPAKAMAVLAGLLIAPLFLRIDRTSLHLGDALYPHNPGQTFPASLVGVGLVLVLALFKTVTAAPRWRMLPLAGLVAVLIVVNLLVLLVGELLATDVQLWSVVFFLQTVTPMLTYFLATNYVRSVETARAVVVTSVMVMGAFVLAMMAVSLHRSGVAGTISDGLYWMVFFLPIYATFDYFPLVVTVAYGLGLALLLGGVPVRGRIYLITAVAAMLVSVFLLHSRGALLTLAAVTGVQLALFGNYPPSRSRALIAAAACAAVVLFTLVGPESLTIAYFRSDEFRLAREHSIEARTDRFALFSDDVLDHPLMGSAYRPQYEVLGTAHLGNPHDQYLTYGVRGGLISTVIFVGILLLVLRQLTLVRQRVAGPLEYALAAGLFSVVLGVALVSNPLQDNFTQPYSGLLLWFLIGVSEALYVLKRRPPPAEGFVPP